MRKAEHWVGDQFIVFVSSDCSIRLSGLRKQKETDESLPGGCVGGGGGGFGLFPNVVNAVELTPKSTIKMVKSIVRLPHCVNRFNGCISKCVIIGYVFDSRVDSQKAVEVAPFFTQFYFSRISPEFVYLFVFFFSMPNLSISIYFPSLSSKLLMSLFGSNSLEAIFFKF